MSTPSRDPRHGASASRMSSPGAPPATGSAARRGDRGRAGRHGGVRGPWGMAWMSPASGGHGERAGVDGRRRPHRRLRPSGGRRHPRLRRARYSVVNETGAGIVTWLPGAGDRRAPGPAALPAGGSAGDAAVRGGPRVAGVRPRHDAGSRRARAAAEPGRARVRPWARRRPVRLVHRGRDRTVAAGARAARDRHRSRSARSLSCPGRCGSPPRLCRSAPRLIAGVAVLSGTSDTPAVAVSLTVGGPAVQPGDPVLVTMPNGTATVPGVVASVGRVATSRPGLQRGGARERRLPPPSSRSRSSISMSGSQPASTRRPSRWPSRSSGTAERARRPGDRAAGPAGRRLRGPDERPGAAG